jgi:RecB family exonuclease
MLQERRALALLFIIAVVLAATSLFLESVGKRAFAIKYSNNTSDGTLVTLDGTIDRITSTASGGNQIVQVSGVRVFIPSTVAS